MPSLPLWQDLLSHLALKGAALLTTTFLLGLTLHRLSAARRYVLWIGAALALTVLPLAIPFLPAWRVLPAPVPSLPFEIPEEEMAVPPQLRNVEATAVPPAKSPSAPALASPTPNASPAPQLPSPLSFSWPDLLAALPLIWLGLCLLFLTRIALSAWRLRRLEKRCSPIPAGPFTDLAAELGLRRLPAFLLGPRDAVPMVWGILRTRLLLPRDYENWPPNKLRSVLLHEFAHLKRRDPAALLLGQIMQALHALNPLAWLVLRRLRADQERACDDAVLRHGIRASEYAQHLFDLSRGARLAPGLSLCALAMARPAPIECRVNAILDPKCPRQPAGRGWSSALLALTFLIAAPLAMLHALEESAKLRGRILDRHGRVLAESTSEKSRNYPLKALTAHLLGYVRQPDKHFPDRIYGATGMEVPADTTLAAGRDVTLTVDARIQQIAYRVLAGSGHARGAIAILDPRSGALLASISLPTFDANLFVPAPSKETWSRLLADTEIPLLDRAIRGATPGAAFMPVTALAAVSAGKTNAHHKCNGSVTYGDRSMLCWIGEKSGGHGTLSMGEALVRSCNCYWYQLGNELGADAIVQVGRALRLGAPEELVPGSDKGILPNETWLKQHRPTEKWSLGHTANLAIGQGAVTVSPLQMALLAATLANGGKVPKPTLFQHEDSAWLADLSNGGELTTEIEVIRKALWEKVNGSAGTGQRARSDKYAIAGMTGTAQNWRKVNGQTVPDNNGWFIGFAPYEQPTLAFAIFVQGVKSGGADCAPLAKPLVEQTLALPADGSGQVDPVEAPVKTVLTKPIEEVQQALRAWMKSPEEQRKLKFPPDLNEVKPKLHPDDEKRWRWLQKLGDLQELPRDAQAIQSGLEGQSFPRTSTFSFQAPRESVRIWLGGSPGYWRYERGLHHAQAASLVPNSLARSLYPSGESIASLASALEYTLGPPKPAALPAWPVTGHIGAFGCASSARAHCTVTLTSAAEPLIRVAVTYRANPSSFRLTE